MIEHNESNYGFTLYRFLINLRVIEYLNSPRILALILILNKETL